MQYDRVIEQTILDAQNTLWANLPPANKLPDDRTVVCLRAIVGAPEVQRALEYCNDTALAFVLRAVNRVLSENPHAHRETINRLWDVLDDPELNRALGIKQNSRMMFGRKKPPAR